MNVIVTIGFVLCFLYWALFYIFIILEERKPSVKSKKEFLKVYLIPFYTWYRYIKKKMIKLIEEYKELD